MIARQSAASKRESDGCVIFGVSDREDWGGMGFGTLFAPQSAARREGKECLGCLPTPLVFPTPHTQEMHCIFSARHSFPSRLHWKATVHKSVPKPTRPTLFDPEPLYGHGGMVGVGDALLVAQAFQPVL